MKLTEEQLVTLAYIHMLALILCTSTARWLYHRRQVWACTMAYDGEPHPT